MSSAVKRALSASTNGLGIRVTATGTPGTLIHTASAVPAERDEVWLWAFCNDSVNAVIYVEWGDAVMPRKVTIPASDGMVPIVPGLILQGGATVRVYCLTAGIIMIDGFVNRITD